MQAHLSCFFEELAKRKHTYHFEITTINPGNALPFSSKGTLGVYFQNDHRGKKREDEQNREEGEMAQTKLGGGRNRGKSREEGEKK